MKKYCSHCGAKLNEKFSYHDEGMDVEVNLYDVHNGNMKVVDRGKTAARSYEDWIKNLKSKGVAQNEIDQFRNIWKSSLSRGESEEYAARAAIDSLPKGALEKPTKVHGPEKAGPLSK